MKTLFNSLFLVNKYRAALLLLVIMSAAISCKNDDPKPNDEKPIANFDYTFDNTNTLMISFSNTSQDGVAYSWDFGDGETSEEESPMHIYEHGGDYIVTLTVNNSDGNAIKTETITVKDKYLDIVYDETRVTKKSNIVYGTNNSYNKLDLYESVDDEEEMRPLILLSPGGAFNSWTRTWEMENLSKDLAQRGYVVAGVKYGLDPDVLPNEIEKVQKLWVEGVIDQKTAIRFFKANAEEYRIDPDKIFIGGWSTGGQLALTTAAFEEEEFAEIRNEVLRDALSVILQETGFVGKDHLEYDSKVRGALMLNVYSFETNFIDADGPAMMFIHHQYSRIPSLPGILTIDTFTIGQDEFYGPIPLTNYARDMGFELGNDLEFITLSRSYNEPNIAALDPANYNDIATFFYNNIQ